ncbi:MAG: alpha/beta fold hydrolase [Gammaproteobacteria bacterium]|nr:alpha/beta fold hydrolase [Gammaproteobacteria bacterium]
MTQQAASGAPPRGEIVRNGDLETHYLSYGEGPAVVFLHGSGPGASGYSNFKLNVEAVVAAGHRAIVIDMIGFGYSSKPSDIDYTTALFADNVKATLDQLGIEQCTLLGNSLGGAICIRLALDFPQLVTRLIMMAPGGIEEKDRYFAMPGIAKMVSAFVGGGLDRDGLRQILEILVHDPKHVTDALVEERFCILETQPPDVLSRMIIPNMAAELPNLQCPVYGFWGEQDEMTPVSGVAHFTRQCQQAQFLTLSQCGHWVMVEHAGLFNAHLTGILDGNLSLEQG